MTIEQTTKTDPLLALQNKFVKATYDDAGNLQIFKGTLIFFNPEWLTIEGDFCRRTIKRSAVISLTIQKTRGE